jgi:hypothetical protein
LLADSETGDEGAQASGVPSDDSRLGANGLDRLSGGIDLLRHAFRPTLLRAHHALDRFDSIGDLSCLRSHLLGCGGILFDDGADLAERGDNSRSPAPSGELLE